ncbi:glutathione hydrolase 7 isoform X2 [Orussus abietinus]|uniref:glutathione hydrolase 7 isoform X2 n=1 Tax=Orussus abietinus TaxID=222816 RepID=UPI00062696A2|nr:glutathione hydrolase 7 isoform X2 [Orussus abietinus]XP_023287747.1 glutathione hydrolase 7 isoform X2 [Orussus abietinus]
MFDNDRQNLTEGSPLTTDSSNQWRLSNCCNSLRLIICCFITLSIGITIALILDIIYRNNTAEILVSDHGAVATDYTNCSKIGTTLLRKGGNAVDAAVAATICMAVVAPHKTGLGGGGYVMIYNHKGQENPLLVDFANNTIEGDYGSVNVRIPAFLRGLELAHSLQGNLHWHEVVKPSVNLARMGFIVSDELANELSKNTDFGLPYGHLIPNEKLMLPNLATTLEAVAHYGADALYNGTMSLKVVRDAVVKKDLLHQLADYKPQVSEAQQTNFYHHVIYYPSQSTDLPRALEELEKLHIPFENASRIDSQILVSKTLIRSYFADRKMESNYEDGMYTSVVAMDKQDTYVSIVTGLSRPLGLGHMTEAGFLLDYANQLSSLSPIIFRHESNICSLRGVLGADDPVLISELLYNIIVRHLNVSAAVEFPRYFVKPDGIVIENDDKHAADTMLRVQLINLSNADPNQAPKSVNVIIKNKDSMTSHSDSRGGGLASRY